MRHIHICAPLGFLLNCLAGYVYSDMFKSGAAALMAGDPQTAAALVAAQKIYPVMLALQALGLGLIAMRVRAGIYLAVLGAVFMMPLGLIFIVGCLFSHAAMRYNGFPVVSALPANPGRRFPAAVTRPLGISALLLGLFGGGLLTYGFYQLTRFIDFLAEQPSPDMSAAPDVGNMFQFGLLLAGFAVVQAVLYRRSRKAPALTLLDDSCVIVPGLFGPRLRIPYADIRLASLNSDASVVALDVDLPAGPRRLFWPVKLVAEPFRRQSLEALGTALTEAGVPLE